MESGRLPRFKRSLALAPFRLTERDREILKRIHQHRFLRSDHLANLLSGSPQQLRRRLQLLYHHGYLERPRCQIDYYQRGGSRSIAYGIGNKGAGLLKRGLALPYPRLDWPKKNRVARLFLEHALLVSDVMVAVEQSCRNRRDVRLLLPDETNRFADAAKKRGPFRWKVTIGNRLKCRVVPDRVFGLEFTDAMGRKQQSWFCLEADRATMPVKRGNLEQSSIHRKLLAYAATWTQNLQRTRFGWQRFRVLTVTNNPERIATMQQAVRSLERGQGLFLFINSRTLEAEADFFSARWQTCRDGESVRLLD